MSSTLTTLFVTPSAAELVLRAAEKAANIDAFRHFGDVEGFTVSYEHPTHGHLVAVFDGIEDGFEVTFNGPQVLYDVIVSEGWMNAADACLNYLADALPDVSLRFDSFELITKNNKATWIGTKKDLEVNKSTSEEGKSMSKSKTTKRALRRIIGWTIAGVTANGVIGGATQGAMQKYGDTPAKSLGIAALGIAGIVGATYLSCSKILDVGFDESL